MKIIFRVILCFTLIIFLITGCASMEPVTLNTPTGKADVIIPNASKAEIADKIGQTLRGAGMQVLEVVQFLGDADKITNAMLSSDFQLEMRDQDINVLSFVKRSSEEWLFRYTYNIVNHPPEGVRVISNISRIHYPGRRNQVVTDISRGSKAAESAYLLLTKIRDGFSQQQPAKERTATGIGMTMKNYTITLVAQGGAAEKAGLKKGDIILKINDEPTTGDEVKDAIKIMGKPGATVKLLIKRNNQERVINLAR